MNSKLEQYNRSIKKALATVIQKELPNVGPITVVDVLIDPSLQHGRVWLACSAETLKLVEEKRSNLQGNLKRYVKTRYTPRLQFLIDDQYLTKMDDLFEKVTDEDQNTTL